MKNKMMQLITVLFLGSLSCLAAIAGPAEEAENYMEILILTKAIAISGFIVTAYLTRLWFHDEIEQLDKEDR